MVEPTVRPVCVLHPANDDPARLARVDAAADRQAAARLRAQSMAYVGPAPRMAPTAGDQACEQCGALLEECGHAF